MSSKYSTSTWVEHPGLICSNFFLIAVILIFLNIGAVAQSVPKRKNIDHLTHEELAAYEHAIQILKDRSASDPYHLESYSWQAWVHNINHVNIPVANTMKQGSNNPTTFYEAASKASYDNSTDGFPGMCEHGKDIFFWWHRAQFYYYEKILQNTDPDGTVKDSRGITGPSTSSVAVPYWNFSRRPSGKRFPQVFEDESSPLYHDGRQTAAVVFPFTSKYLLAHQLYYLNWPQYGGYPDGTYGGYGNFESMTHNPMHSIYIGGDMASPSTAAYDPIFYSFHSYIDLLLEEYLKIHPKEKLTSQNYYLRGQLPEKYNLPNYSKGSGDRPVMGQAKIYHDITKLGYGYEVLASDAFISKAALDKLLKGGDGEFPVFGTSNTSLFYLLFGAEGSFSPKSTLSTTQTTVYPINSNLEKTQQNYVYATNNKGSFQMDVYIYPKDVVFDVTSECFRKKFLANIAVFWGDKSGHHTGRSVLNANITDAARDLFKTRNGETWQLSINVTNL